MGSCWLRQCDLVLVLVLVMVTSSAIELTGDNVCPRVENYTVTFKESYMEPVIVNTFAWCLQIPPRCPRSRIEMRERWRIKTETRRRTVMDCCDGYSVKTVKKELSIKYAVDINVCEARCEICEYGRCVSPNTCVCDPGHRGDGCAYECSAGTWGEGCSRKCNCKPLEICNPVDGKCHCPPGWEGSGCKDKCQFGLWGIDCAYSCMCNNNGNKTHVQLETGEFTSACHHETGNCVDLEHSSVSFITEKINWTNGNAAIETTTPLTTTTFRSSPLTESKLLDRTHASTLMHNSLKAGEDIENDDDDDANNDDVTDDDDDYDNDHDDDRRQDYRIAVEPRSSRTTESEIDYYKERSTSTSTERSLSEISLDPVVLEIGTIETSSITTSTGTNENGNYNGQLEKEQSVERIDMKVPRVKKPSTPRPIVAVVHVSGKALPGHDGTMIMTSLGSEKIPTHAVPMPLDVAALIVVGSVISLGLTTLVVLAILHIRSKLFDTIRLSIYDAEKRNTSNCTLSRGGGEKGNAGRISTVACNSGILTCEYETPRCIIPEHQTLTRPRPPSSAEVMKKQESNYSNDYPNIRLFSNIQELLEAHYDRPPSTFRQAVVDVDGEHVYDEIPLQSSTTFSTKRNT